jgi:hypothetical protein
MALTPGSRGPVELKTTAMRSVAKYKLHGLAESLGGPIRSSRGPLLFSFEVFLKW